MPLQLPKGARFAKLPPDQAIPFEFVNEIDDLIGKIAAQGERRALLEHFKGEFCAAIGAPHVWSSDEGWAYTDLHRAMQSAAQNPALFIQAFYDGCEGLRDQEDLEVPSVELLNDLLGEHNVPYEVRPPRLLNVRGTTRVPTPAPPPALSEEEAAVVQRSVTVDLGRTPVASTPEWDVFVCHASEDKKVARSLADGLRSRGVRVWLDENVLKIGDSLRRTIDRGLARSRFGAVILSPRFLQKEWPQRELDGLAAQESSGRKVILPVWHEIDFVAVQIYSPTLADRLAAQTVHGLDRVVDQLYEVIRE